MNIREDLIQKYNVAAPRYTSYPPVPFWQRTPSQNEWIDHVKTKYDPNTGLDLYVHIPYCESLCYYCGCNRTISKDHGVEEEFVSTLLKEWELYCNLLGFTPKVGSLHLGGGTPTYLSPSNLRKILDTLTKNKTESFIGSIEVDPRTCTKEHIQLLIDVGVKRVSLGIQDFDPKVQAAINRYQSPAMVKSLVEHLRKSGVTSINFDLIYGLPLQTVQSIEETIKEARSLGPDLIAFYSYAHLPDRIKNQRLIKEAELPSGPKKRELYEVGKALLAEAGYSDVGMDHFARPGSYLHEALKNHELHRNFMGYVDKKSSVLLGLGPSSISDSSLSFMQNQKEIKVYYSSIQAGNLAIEKGHIQSSEDLLVQETIQRLMCRDEVDLTKVKSLSDWTAIEAELRGYQQDGLITIKANEMRLSRLGKAFMRNVATSFDFYLRRSKNIKFSQTI